MPIYHPRWCLRSRKALGGGAEPDRAAPDGDVARGRNAGERETDSDSHVSLDDLAAVCAAYADGGPVRDGIAVTDPSAGVPGHQDDDVSVLTFDAGASASAASEIDSEACLPDDSWDDESIMTRRTTNCSFRSNLRSRSLEARPARKTKQLVDDSIPKRRTANCSFRSNLVTRSRSLDFVASSCLPGRLADDPTLATTVTQSDEELRLPSLVPLLRRGSNVRSPSSFASRRSFASSSRQKSDERSHLPSTQTEEGSHLPPPILPPPVRDLPEEGTQGTLYTAVAEARVLVDNGNNLNAPNAHERSLFIKQGRCPSCGIQTHKTSAVFKKLSPLSYEQVLEGRCLMCNPINIVTPAAIDTLPFSAESGARNETVADAYLNEGGQHSGLHAHVDTVLERETKPKESPTNALSFDYSRKTSSVSFHLVPSKDEDNHSTRSDPTPSAPFLDAVRSESKSGDAQSNARPHGEMERWLLSHIPTLKMQDVESYCRCLDQDGFDSIRMLDVLEEGDLSFMKPAHRRVLTNRLRSRRCENPRGVVQHWLLLHLPTLKQQDMERYCHCLDEGGFDSILMLGALEEGDLGFMKPAHRRVLMNGLQQSLSFGLQSARSTEEETFEATAEEEAGTTVKEAPKEAPEDVPEEVTKETTKEAAEEVPEEDLARSAEGATQETTKEATKEAAEEVPEEAAEDIPAGETHETPEEAVFFC